MQSRGGRELAKRSEARGVWVGETVRRDAVVPSSIGKLKGGGVRVRWMVWWWGAWAWVGCGRFEWASPRNLTPCGCPRGALRRDGLTRTCPSSDLRCVFSLVSPFSNHFFISRILSYPTHIKKEKYSISRDAHKNSARTVTD